MKKIWILFIIFLGVFAINVYAGPDDPTDPTGGTDPDPNTNPDTSEVAWPKEYTFKDYKININGVFLNVYKIEKPEETTSSSSSSTNDDNEMIYKYIKEEPTRVVTLDPTKFTINPELKEDELVGYDALFIDLNLNLTKAKMEELLAEEINTTSDSVAYIVDVVVKFKLNDYPEPFKNFRKFSLLRDTFVMPFYYSDKYNNTNEVAEIGHNPVIDITNETSQVMNLAVIGMYGGTQAELNYETKLTEDNDWADYLTNFTIMSENEIDYDTVLDEKDKDKIQLMMIHDAENIDYYINYMKKITTSSDELDELMDDLLVEQQVQVPNTAFHMNKLWIMVGIVSVLTGLMLIAYTLKMIQFRKIRKQETI